MAREVRHPLSPAAEQDGPVPVALTAQASAADAKAASLDPLVRALDRAISRAQRTGFGGSSAPP